MEYRAFKNRKMQNCVAFKTINENDQDKLNSAISSNSFTGYIRGSNNSNLLSTSESHAEKMIIELSKKGFIHVKKYESDI